MLSKTMTNQLMSSMIRLVTQRLFTFVDLVLDDTGVSEHHIAPSIVDSLLEEEVKVTALDAGPALARLSSTTLFKCIHIVFILIHSELHLVGFQAHLEGHLLLVVLPLRDLRRDVVVLFLERLRRFLEMCLVDLVLSVANFSKKQQLELHVFVEWDLDVAPGSGEAVELLNLDVGVR